MLFADHINQLCYTICNPRIYSNGVYKPIPPIVDSRNCLYINTNFAFDNVNYAYLFNEIVQLVMRNNRTKFLNEQKFTYVDYVEVILFYHDSF